MKTSMITLAFTALFGLGVLNATNISPREVTPCEHCTKDHKCDDKCKKDEKSKCCKADGTQNENGEATSSCCKKGEKQGKKGQKKAGKQNQQGQVSQPE